MRHRLVVFGLVALLGLMGCGDDDGTPSGGGGPVSAEFDVTPASGTILTDFSFDAGGSSFAADDYEYRWDWENDGVWDTDWSTAATATHRYDFWEGDDFDTVEVQLAVRKGSSADSAVGRVVIDTRHGLMLESFPVHPANSSGLGSDGTHLWLADWGSPGTGRIYKYDPSTGDTLYSLQAPDIWPGGVTWDGSYLCVSHNRAISRMDPVTGDVMSSFEVVYSKTHAGLAWDGATFYFASRFKEGTTGDGRIHKYSSDGVHQGSFESPRGSVDPSGLAFDGKHLWAGTIENDTLYVLDPDSGDILWQIYQDTNPHDLTFIDGYLWTLGYITETRLSRVVP
jgi:hypothetical protein